MISKRSKARGELCADRLYSARGLMRAMGWARRTIEEAKSSGIVKTYYAGGMACYLGSELIEWAKTKRRTT